MLNIEVIRFEAQDVITASVAAPVEIKHTANCAAIKHHPGQMGYPNAIWVDGEGWVDCDCECHK